jgi:hypothetical protein
MMDYGGELLIARRISRQIGPASIPISTDKEFTSWLCSNESRERFAAAASRKRAPNDVECMELKLNSARRALFPPWFSTREN